MEQSLSLLSCIGLLSIKQVLKFTIEAVPVFENMASYFYNQFSQLVIRIRVELSPALYQNKGRPYFYL